MRAMDDIVEKFLLEKLDEDIKYVREAADEWGKKSLSKCKLFAIHDVCGELKKLMEQKKPGTGAARKDTRREKLYYLLNLMAEWRDLLEKQSRALLCPDDFSRRLKQVKKDLEQPTPQQPSPDLKDPQVYRWSCHAVDLTKIHGFKEKRMIMERLLLNKAPKAIGIVGVAGVGKTALCQQAYNHQPVQKQFLLRIWLCSSKHQKIIGAADVQVFVSFEDQMKRILSCLGFEEKVIQGVEKLKMAVQHQLNRGGYLIVLDDVWTIKDNDKVVVEEETKKLFSFLTQHSSRYQGKLILTSRSPELEKMVGPENMHRLLPLADSESCWNIFTDAYVEDGKKTPEEEMAKLKTTILGKCDGLPMMAKMLGKIGNHETENPTKPNSPGT